MSGCCKHCRSNSIVHDDISANLFCSSCGLVSEFDGYDAQIGGLNGPEGTYVRVGTSGSTCTQCSSQNRLQSRQQEGEVPEEVQPLQGKSLPFASHLDGPS